MEQTVTDHRHEQLIASRRIASARLTPDQQRRIAFLSLGGIVAFLVIILLLANAYVGRYAGRVYRGVAIAGVPVGGLSQEEALAHLEEQIGAWQVAPIEVRSASGDHQWSIAPADLGVQFDSTGAVVSALQVGRGGNPFGNFGAWFGALRPFGGRDLAIPATYDDNALDATFRSWAGDTTFGPANAVFKVAADGQLMIVADKDGRGIDFDGSRANLVAHAVVLDTAPVTLSEVPVGAPIQEAILREVEPQARAIVTQPLVARYKDRTWTLGPESLAGAIAYQLQDGQLVLSLDPARLRPFFDTIGKDVNTPGVSAKLVPDAASGKYVVAPSQQGFGLDEAASLAAINATLAGGSHEVALTIRALAPPIVEADVEPIRLRLNKLITTPVVVTFEEYKHTLVPADILPIISVTEQPTKAEKVAITLDAAGLRALTQMLAGEINQPVKDAKFKFVNRGITDVEKSQDGREVQFAATDEALRAAILGVTGAAKPAVTVVKPKVASSAKATMLTPDLLGTGVTDYSSSIATRWHNVELAAERLNGTVIPAGEKFSFNAAVGEQTVDNGYQEAYGIALVPGVGGKPGEAKTVSSVAGGICQVSTTLFHGVFRSGMPIEERNWHMFWVAYAGNSRSGLLGLDATVDDQAGLDFQFWNTTGGWLGIQATANDGTLTVSLYGKNPGWKVTIDDPSITNVIQPESEPVYEKTHDLPVGDKLPIEHAAEGFTANIRRRVTDAKGNLVQFNGKPMDTTFKSNYLPSRDRYEIGVPKSEPIDTP